ncbi:legumain-like [Hydractinia symbiolongicarpus]|uniref:legumain-like n=1 Tax=Hydractinia symbiolongicarpus TaxID=13093 RepID=UPI00254A6417|nr:legumain-like [Hydractinia symbiolongicarpus]
MKLYLALGIIVCIGFLEAKHWAVIVAGSSGWYNYRHQADVCHAYQIFHKHGIPDENIIVMMYDDIAHNRNNPTPGIIINKPNGPDVYKGVLKDYTGKDVTPENFLNVLKGNKEAMNGIGSGRVLESGPDDNVFVYFADHGAPNIIAFPSSELHASDLKDAITYMHENKKYKQMVFYIEACESGSMFDRHKLPSNINVFATTAANGAESSYAVYYDQKRGTYLGDVYSVKWLENSDVADFSTETLQQQFKLVKEETNTSHVMEFGDLSMGSIVLGKFQGGTSKNYHTSSLNYSPSSTSDAVPSPEVSLMILYHQIRAAKTSEEKEMYMQKLMKEQEVRSHIHKTVHRIMKKLVVSKSKQGKLLAKTAQTVMQFCYKQVVTKFRNACYDFTKYEHALRHVYIFANLCDEGLSTERILAAIEGACPVAY